MHPSPRPGLPMNTSAFRPRSASRCGNVRNGLRGRQATDSNAVGLIMSTPPLSLFTKAQLMQQVFPGLDAAVVFIPEGQEPSPAVRDVLQRSGQQRWFPVPGGHKAKVPWPLAEGSESLFEREQKGWDHEHCDFCPAHVNIGDPCWSVDSEKGGFWVFCRGCYEKLGDE
jgi:hypothetical protein